MFDKNNSVEDYVKRTIKDEIAKTKRDEEKKGYSVVTPNQNKRIQKFIKTKELEFSFEVKKQKDKFPEIEEIRETSRSEKT
jgi:hypothetical protein